MTTVTVESPTDNSPHVGSPHRLVVDSGIDTQRDLAHLLPVRVRELAEPYLLGLPRQAAALRLLAAVESDLWHGAVSSTRIDVFHLMGCLGPFRANDNRDRVLIECAASLADTAGVLHLPVGLLAHQMLDDEDFLVLIDALRIVREGLCA